MTTPRTSDDDLLDEGTLPDTRVEDLISRECDCSRDIQLRDFKDIGTTVTVAHGPSNPSRVWLSLNSGETSILLSVEEGTARRLSDGLIDALARFSKVRSAVR